MNYTESIKFFFTSPNWKNNALFGTLFMMIPIIGPIALLGWQSEIARRLHFGHDNPISDVSFDNLSEYLSDGLAPFVGQLVGALPILVITIGMAVVMPFAIVVSPGAGLVVILGMTALMVLLSVPLAVVVAAMQTRGELSADLGETLKFGPAMAFTKKMFLPTLVAIFVFSIQASVLIFAGALVCCIGMYPAAVAAQVGSVHLRHQLYQQYVEGGGEPWTVKSLDKSL